MAQKTDPLKEVYIEALIRNPNQVGCYRYLDVAGADECPVRTGHPKS